MVFTCSGVTSGSPVSRVEFLAERIHNGVPITRGGNDVDSAGGSMCTCACMWWSVDWSRTVTCSVLCQLGMKTETLALCSCVYEYSELSGLHALLCSPTHMYVRRFELGHHHGDSPAHAPGKLGKGMRHSYEWRGFCVSAAEPDAASSRRGFCVSAAEPDAASSRRRTPLGRVLRSPWL